MPGMKPPAATIDDFLADVPEHQRAGLEDLRQKIHAAAPDAVEVIAYGVPGFRLRGKYLVGFGAAKRHCSFYSGAALQGFTADLSGYETTTGTIHFSPDKPLTASLVTKLVKARIVEVEKRRSRQA